MVGTLLILTGFFTLTRLDVDSSLVLVGVGVCQIGLGLGMCMQILILATQNAVKRADLASATSAVSFFRNLGGAVGVAAFGSVMTNVLHDELAQFAARAGGSGAGRMSDAGTGSPEAIHSLPPAAQEAVITAFSNAMHTVFTMGIPIAAVAFVLVLFFKQIPLRSGRSRTESKD